MTPEGEVKKKICQLLSLSKDVFFWIQESQGTYDPIKKIFRKKASKYQRCGVPDILGHIMVSGIPIPIYFEIKAKNGKQSDNQIKFENECKERGGFYFVIKDAADVVEALATIRTRVWKLIDENPGY